MPHKHKRKRNPHTSDDSCADFDLPPEKRAIPLDASPAVKKNANYKEKFEGFGDVVAGEWKDNNRNKRWKPQARDQRDQDKSKKATTMISSRMNGGRADDTPKQFARMMAWQTRLKEKQKQKTRTRTQSTTETLTQPPHSIEPPTSKPNDRTPATAAADSEQPNPSLRIQKGESLTDFDQRVNRSLPLSGIAKSHPPPPSNNDRKIKKQDKLQIPKDPLTRHNEHLQRMQSEWRNAETKLQARRAEADEAEADQREEDAVQWMDVVAARNSRKGKKKKSGGNEEDVWKVLEKKRWQQHRDAVLVPVTTSVAGLTASKSVQAPLPQSTMRKLDVERVKRMFRGVE